MFPHPGRLFLSYPRPPSSHIEQKSKKCSEFENYVFFRIFYISPRWSYSLLTRPEALCIAKVAAHATQHALAVSEQDGWMRTQLSLWILTTQSDATRHTEQWKVRFANILDYVAV